MTAPTLATASFARRADQSVKIADVYENEALASFLANPSAAVDQSDFPDIIKTLSPSALVSALTNVNLTNLLAETGQTIQQYLSSIVRKLPNLLSLADFGAGLDLTWLDAALDRLISLIPKSIWDTISKIMFMDILNFLDKFTNLLGNAGKEILCTDLSNLYNQSGFDLPDDWKSRFDVGAWAAYMFAFLKNGLDLCTGIDIVGVIEADTKIPPENQNVKIQIAKDLIPVAAEKRAHNSLAQLLSFVNADLAAWEKRDTVAATLKGYSAPTTTGADTPEFNASNFLDLLDSIDPVWDVQDRNAVSSSKASIYTGASEDALKLLQFNPRTFAPATLELANATSYKSVDVLSSIFDF